MTEQTQAADPHRPADDSEEIYFDGSPSAVASLGHVILFLVIGVGIAALPFLISSGGHEIPGWAYLVGIVLGVLLLLIPWVKIRSQRYRISNYRIDYERGWLWKRIDTMELWHVEDLSFTQSPVARIFGLGTITIVSHDPTTPHLVIAGLPNARPTFDTLKQRIIAVKRQRGVIKMDVGS
ncbi:MAG TPA: PH domain-containing protein [Tepidisphaeraceae bacterium]|jgi:membrane protein YdbS with pleckstrin-like domain|nr:PH domain-containing protein [Tepidisphaeraceae bacterium]